MPHTPTHAVVWLDHREAKKEFDKYLDQHAEELKKKLIGVETMDHPTDGELLAHARKFLKAHDRMAPHDPRIERAMRGGTARG